MKTSQKGQPPNPRAFMRASHIQLLTFKPIWYIPTHDVLHPQLPHEEHKKTHTAAPPLCILK